LYLI
jgi:hypothetical protein